MLLIFIVILIAGAVILAYVLLTSMDKSTDEPDDDTKLIMFTNTAHEAYIIACDKEDVRYFEKYAEPEVIHELRDLIEYGESQLYGLEKYRDRKVIVINNTQTHAEVEIEITHGQLRVNRTSRVNAGDHTVEFWKVKTRGDNYKVTGIYD